MIAWEFSSGGTSSASTSITQVTSPSSRIGMPTSEWVSSWPGGAAVSTRPLARGPRGQVGVGIGQPGCPGRAQA